MTTNNSDQNNAHLLFFQISFFTYEKNFFFLNTNITESDYISKTKNRTKNIINAKNERQINSNLP